MDLCSCRQDIGIAQCATGSSQWSTGKSQCATGSSRWSTGKPQWSTGKPRCSTGLHRIEFAKSELLIHSMLLAEVDTVFFTRGLATRRARLSSFERRSAKGLRQCLRTDQISNSKLGFLTRSTVLYSFLKYFCLFCRSVPARGHLRLIMKALLWQHLASALILLMVSSI